MKWKIEEIADDCYAIYIDNPNLDPREALIGSGIPILVAQNMVLFHNSALDELEDELMGKITQLEEFIEELS